ncbi:hypothetical protein [Thalassotalea ganghwensis]
MLGSFRDMWHKALGDCALLFAVIILSAQLLGLYFHGLFLVLEGYGLLAQALLVPYALIQFKKSKKNKPWLWCVTAKPVT